MKKIISFSLLILTIVAIYHVSYSSHSINNVSFLTLTNIEALARNESGNENKVKVRTDYIKNETLIIEGITFNCVINGTDCEGSGNIECIETSRMDCVRAR